jgi:hypothetical protein
MRERERIWLRTRLLAGQRLERDSRQRVDVDRGMRRVALKLLSFHVTEGADHLPGGGDLRVVIDRSDPEIGQLHGTATPTGMFAGFTSRCTIPRACTASSAAAAALRLGSALDGARAPRVRIRYCRVSPQTYSMTMTASPSPVSQTS